MDIKNLTDEEKEQYRKNSIDFLKDESALKDAAVFYNGKLWLSDIGFFEKSIFVYNFWSYYDTQLYSDDINLDVLDQLEYNIEEIVFNTITEDTLTYNNINYFNFQIQEDFLKFKQLYYGNNSIWQGKIVLFRIKDIYFELIILLPKCQIESVKNLIENINLEWNLTKKQEYLIRERQHFINILKEILIKQKSSSEYRKNCIDVLRNERILLDAAVYYGYEIWITNVKFNDNNISIIINDLNVICNFDYKTILEHETIFRLYPAYFVLPSPPEKLKDYFISCDLLDFKDFKIYEENFQRFHSLGYGMLSHRQFVFKILKNLFRNDEDRKKYIYLYGGKSQYGVLKIDMVLV
ncbi:MAG: hypothetical protein FWD71_01645 [Oscillospiraceae bacterium]|nr:hypothetical protein [Oscillospiraceae bacterium]